MLDGLSLVILKGMPFSRIDWRRKMLIAVDRSMPISAYSSFASRLIAGSVRKLIVAVSLIVAPHHMQVTVTSNCSANVMLLSIHEIPPYGSTFRMAGSSMFVISRLCFGKG